MVQVINIAEEGPQGPPGPPGAISPVLGGNFFLQAPTNGTVPVIPYAPYGFTINGLYNLCITGGSISVSVLINGVAVTGLTNVAVTTTPQTPVATALNVVNVGDEVEITLSNNSFAASLKFTLIGTIT